MFDRPPRVREFFEAVIRENLDLGRPDRVQLLFDRKIWPFSSEGGIIARAVKSDRYFLTPYGWRVSLFTTRHLGVMPTIGMDVARLIIARVE